MDEKLQYKLTKRSLFKTVNENSRPKAKPRRVGLIQLKGVFY